MNGINSNPRRERYRPILALSALTLVLLGGCQKKPGGQVIAVVNSEEITQSEVRAEADAAGIPAGQDFQAYAPVILERVIDRNLLADYARKQGLDRGPEYVARRRALEQTLLAQLGMRKLVGTPAAPSAADIQSFIRSNPAVFANRQKLALDQIRFATPTDPTKVKEYTALGSMSAIEAKLKADGTPMARGTAALDTGAVDPIVARQVAGLPDGQVFDLSTNGTTFISSITGRVNVATPPETWQRPATAILQRQRLQKSVADSMANLRKDAKVQYDPAFRASTISKK
jgi:EpsD family peptidyl-prolyl cis-trans isomerase